MNSRNELSLLNTEINRTKALEIYKSGNKTVKVKEPKTNVILH